MNSLKETTIKTFMRVLENHKLPDIPREQKNLWEAGPDAPLIAATRLF